MCGAPRNTPSSRRVGPFLARTAPGPRDRSWSRRCRACSALSPRRARPWRGAGNRGSAAAHGAGLSARRTPARPRSTQKDSRTRGRPGLCRSTPLPFARSPGGILCRAVKRRVGWRRWRRGAYRVATPPRRSGSGDRTEESVRLVVWTGREEERVGRPVVGRPVSELQSPEAVDRDRLRVAVPQLAAVLELSIRPFLVCVYPPVAEVSHEEIAAEASEIRGSERESPRCVELAVLRDPHEQRAGGVVNVDEALALAVDLVGRIRVLFRIRHEDARTDRLYPERRVPRGQVRVLERAGAGYQGEARVEHVDTPVVKVRHVEPVARRRRREREPLVDRADRGTVGKDHGLIP